MSSSKKLKKIFLKRKLKLSNGSRPIQYCVIMVKILSSTLFLYKWYLNWKLGTLKLFYMNSCLSLMLTGLLTLFKIFPFRKGSLFLFFFLFFFFLLFSFLPLFFFFLAYLFVILAILTLDFKINSIEPRNGTLFSINICLSEPGNASLCFAKDYGPLNYSAFCISVYLSWLNNIFVCYLFAFWFSILAIVWVLYFTQISKITKSALMNASLEDLLWNT